MNSESTSNEYSRIFKLTVPPELHSIDSSSLPAQLQKTVQTRLSAKTLMGRQPIIKTLIFPLHWGSASRQI